MPLADDIIITREMREDWARNYNFLRELREKKRLTVSEMLNQYGPDIDAFIRQRAKSNRKLKPLPPIPGVDE